MLTAELSRVQRLRWQMTKHLSSAATLPRWRGRGSGSSTGYRWRVPAVRNHCDSPPREHQGHPTSLHPAQMDMTNSAFSSRKCPLSFAPELCLKAEKQAGLPVAFPLPLTQVQTSPLADLPKPLLLLYLKTPGVLRAWSIVSTRGLSASHLNPAADSVAACGGCRAALPRPALGSGEIGQSPTCRAGILSRTRGDRLQEIFHRVATRGPKRDFCAACAGGDGTGTGASGKFLRCQRGKVEKALVCRTLRCRVCKAWGANPPEQTGSFPRPRFCLDGDGNEAQAQELGERRPLCSLPNTPAPPPLAHLRLAPGYFGFCKHHDSASAAAGLRDQAVPVQKAHGESEVSSLSNQQRPGPAPSGPARLPPATRAPQGRRLGERRRAWGFHPWLRR